MFALFFHFLGTVRMLVTTYYEPRKGYLGGLNSQKIVLRLSDTYWWVGPWKIGDGPGPGLSPFMNASARPRALEFYYVKKARIFWSFPKSWSCAPGSFSKSRALGLPKKHEPWVGPGPAGLRPWPITNCNDWCKKWTASLHYFFYFKLTVQRRIMSPVNSIDWLNGQKIFT